MMKKTIENLKSELDALMVEYRKACARMRNTQGWDQEAGDLMRDLNAKMNRIELEIREMEKPGYTKRLLKEAKKFDAGYKFRVRCGAMDGNAGILIPRSR